MIDPVSSSQRSITPHPFAGATTFINKLADKVKALSFSLFAQNDVDPPPLIPLEHSPRRPFPLTESPTPPRIRKIRTDYPDTLAPLQPLPSSPNPAHHLPSNPPDDIPSSSTGVDSSISPLDEATLSRIAFGKTKWKKHLGSIKKKLPLTDEIARFLNSPCPFWPEKKVHETHALILFPAKVDGEPFRIEKLKSWIRFLQEFKETEVKSHWGVITKKVIPKSAQNYPYCINRIPKGYSLPTVLEAATLLVTEYIEKDTRLLPIAPSMSTYCAEYCDSQGRHFSIGNFSKEGFAISLGTITGHDEGCLAIKRF